MNLGINIRKASIFDKFEVISSLIYQSAPELFNLLCGDEVKKIITQLLKLNQNRFSYHYVYIAEIEGEIMGIALLIPTQVQKANSDYTKVLNWWQQWRWYLVENLILKRIIKTDYPENSYYLANLAVKPEYQSLGIGTKLIQYCQQQAKRQGATSLWISVSIDNPRARQLYQKQGFEVKETKTISIRGKPIGTYALVYF